MTRNSWGWLGAAISRAFGANPAAPVEVENDSVADEKNAARARLHALLRQQAEHLKPLGQQPLAVASAFDKFNDAREDDFWCAVQLGRYRWEQSQFFGSWAGSAHAEETASISLSEDDQGAADAVSNDIAAARRVLKTLDDAGWHGLVEAAYGIRRSGHILALVIQFNQVWLHTSNPMGYERDELYAVGQDGLFFFARHEDRFDELIGQPELIRNSAVSEEAAAAVPPAVRAQLGHSVQDTAAAKELSALMLRASAALRDIFNRAIRHPLATDLPKVVIDLPPAPYEQRRYAWGTDRSRRPPGCSFAVEDIYFNHNHANVARGTHAKSPRVAQYVESLDHYPFAALASVVAEIEKWPLRDCFERATGIDTFDVNELQFFDDGTNSVLVYRKVLFRATADGIVPEAAGIDPEVRLWIDRWDAIFRQPYTLYR